MDESDALNPCLLHAMAIDDEPAGSSDRAASLPPCKPTPGVRFYTDNAQPLNLFQKAVAAATLLMFIAWIYVLSALMIASLFSKVAALVCLGAWATVLLPLVNVQWRAFIASPLFSLWRRYFSYSICFTQQLDSRRHYLYADFPHGGLKGSSTANKYPGVHVLCCQAITAACAWATLLW